MLWLMLVGLMGWLVVLCLVGVNLLCMLVFGSGYWLISRVYREVLMLWMLFCGLVFGMVVG